MKFPVFYGKREHSSYFCKEPLCLLKYSKLSASLLSCLNCIKELHYFTSTSSTVSSQSEFRLISKVYRHHFMGESHGMLRRKKDTSNQTAKKNPVTSRKKLGGRHPFSKFPGCNLSCLARFVWMKCKMMFTPASYQERQRLEEAAHRDHLVRLHSVHTDLALNLPHSIALPDGEEGPGCQSKHMKLHDPEQQAEITRSFIRPPPNRTITNCNSLPPFRSNSVGHFPKSNALQTLPYPSVLVPRCSNAHGSKMGLSRETPVSSPHQLPSAMNSVSKNTVARNSRMSGANGNSRTCDYTSSVINNTFNECSDPPPPYSDVVNRWDTNSVNRQQNSGV